MERSSDVEAAMARFYEHLTAKDVGSFDSIVSSDPATLVIGTSPGEWVTDRARLRFGFEVEGLRVDGGPSPTGFARADVGRFVDEPDYTFPDGSRMHTRLTAVLQREADDWRIVHMHVSVGVPDDEVVGLEASWTA